METNKKRINKKAESTFKNMLIMIILGLMFTVAIISFGIQFSNDNNTTISILNDARFSGLNKTFYGANKTLYNSLQNSEIQKNVSSQSELTINADSLTINSIWGSITSYFSLVTDSIGFIFSLLAVLGIPTIILGGIVSIILIVIIFLGWKAIRQGQ